MRGAAERQRRLYLRSPRARAKARADRLGVALILLSGAVFWYAMELTLMALRRGSL